MTIAARFVAGQNADRSRTFLSSVATSSLSGFTLIEPATFRRDIDNIGLLVDRDSRFPTLGTALFGNAGQNTWRNEIWWERGEVSALLGLGCHSPFATPVPFEVGRHVLLAAT